MAEKRIFLIFVDLDLNLCKARFRLVRAHLCTDLYENLVGGQIYNAPRNPEALMTILRVVMTILRWG